MSIGPTPFDAFGGQPPLGPAGGQPAFGQAGGQQPFDASSYVQALMEMIAEWQANESDPEDLLALENIRTTLQKIDTRRSKEETDALGGKLSPRLLARAHGA